MEALVVMAQAQGQRVGLAAQADDLRRRQGRAAVQRFRCRRRRTGRTPAAGAPGDRTQGAVDRPQKTAVFATPRRGREPGAFALVMRLRSARGGAGSISSSPKQRW